VDLRPLMQQLGGRLDYDHPLVVLPRLLASLQERFAGLTVDASSELLLVATTYQVLCRSHRGMSRLPADPTPQNLCWFGRFGRFGRFCGGRPGETAGTRAR